MSIAETSDREPPSKLKGKSAIYLGRVYSERKRNFVGQSFWARGYFVSLVGRDEELIGNYYTREREAEPAGLVEISVID